MKRSQRRGLEATRAGVALQAYIPDSDLVLQRLIDWSRGRVAGGGTPLTIRLVKGANLEMERVEASIGGHRQAPYQTKLETDANYKRMLRRLIDATADGIVRVGLASHNLFDVALGLVWAQQRGLSDGIQIEMLEGMANHQRRAISERKSDLLLYAPACYKEGFLNAIGYLIRRLDENTGPQNFLRHAYRLQPDSHEFAQLASDFRRSLELASTVSNRPRRSADRDQKPVQPAAAAHWSELVNEPDTDWGVPAHSQWAQQVLDRWSGRCDDSAAVVGLSIGGEAIACGGEELRKSFDPSRPGVVVCRYQAANLEQVKQAVAVASKDTSGWRRTAAQQRHELLREAAQKLRQRRGDLIGAMVAVAGKTFAEADPEVSEAIDFCEFYPLTAVDWDQVTTITTAPRGVVAVVTPWNFPLAIPCGGVAAALAAGNSVILKPASKTVLPASMLCEAFWDAGIPRDALQLVPCDGAVAGEGLVSNLSVNTVILTGGTSTAKQMLSMRPGLHLLAETGGKNATIVTAMADRDLAIKHVVQSAFGHSGQKCSATSLLLLEHEVFHDQQFKATLADAVESIRVGSAWDLSTRMGPLIGEPTPELTRGLKTLEDDESWLVIPEHVVGNPNLYRPGVKWNIQPGGFTHLTELFGPVLGVMPYSRLEEAIEIVRSTGYGLTSGLESLDDREIELWKRSIHAGNLYVNRPTTGAIVLRQPFGGVGLSAYGPGVKAGGPHYVLALMNIHDSATAENVASKTEAIADQLPLDQLPLHQPSLDQLLEWLEAATENKQIDTDLGQQVGAAIGSARRAVDAEFSREHDTVRLVGQDNLRRYRPTRAITIRFNPSDSLRDALISLAAAVAVQAQVSLSIDPSTETQTRTLLESTADAVPGLIHPIEETETQLVERIREGHLVRLRLLNHAQNSSPAVIACGKAFVTIVDEPVLAEGRIECLRYLDEQSISHDYHRYGNLGRRSGEQRREVL